MTTAQLEQVRKMANEKSVTRQSFQKYLDDGTLADVLSAIKQELPIKIIDWLVAPEGARIFTIEATVDLGEDWDVAVKNGGPNTPADYNIWKVGHLYPVSGAGAVKRRYHLLSWPNGGGSLDKALAWGKKYNLLTTEPREVFGIGKSNPKFNYEVGPNPCYVVATEECAFEGDQQACNVWWFGSKRRADLDWVSDDGNADDWFAFRE